MDTGLECIYCIIDKADLLFSEHETDEDKSTVYKKVFNIISMSEKKIPRPI